METAGAFQRLTLTAEGSHSSIVIESMVEIARRRVEFLAVPITVSGDELEGTVTFKCRGQEALQTALPVLTAEGKAELMSDYFDPRLELISKFDFLAVIGRGLLSGEPLRTGSGCDFRGCKVTRRGLVAEYDVRNEVRPIERDRHELELRIDGVPVGMGTFKEKVGPDPRYSQAPVPPDFQRARFTIDLPPAKALQIGAILNSGPYPRPFK